MKLIINFFVLIVCTIITNNIPLNAQSDEDLMSELVVSRIVNKPLDAKKDEEVALEFIGSPMSKADQSKAELKEKQSRDFLQYIRHRLEEATQQAAKRITDAIKSKNDARITHTSGKITDAEKKLIFTEMDKIIANTKQELLKMTETTLDIADATEKQASYLSKFVSGMHNLGSRTVSSVKDLYYGSSAQERLLAQAVIGELEKLKKKETNPAIIKQIDTEIYNQKLISGDEMTTQKKLLIGATVAAAAVAGVALTNYYFSAPNTPSVPSVTPSAPQTPEITQTSQEPVTITENQTPGAITPVSDQPTTQPATINTEEQQNLQKNLPNTPNPESINTPKPSLVTTQDQPKDTTYNDEINPLELELDSINKRLDEIDTLEENAEYDPEEVKAFQEALSKYESNWLQSENIKKQYDEYQESAHKHGNIPLSFDVWAVNTWLMQEMPNAIKRGDLPADPRQKWMNQNKHLLEERKALNNKITDIFREIEKQEKQQTAHDSDNQPKNKTFFSSLEDENNSKQSKRSSESYRFSEQEKTITAKGIEGFRQQLSGDGISLLFGSNALVGELADLERKNFRTVEEERRIAEITDILSLTIDQILASNDAGIVCQFLQVTKDQLRGRLERYFFERRF